MYKFKNFLFGSLKYLLSISLFITTFNCVPKIYLDDPAITYKQNHSYDIDTFYVKKTKKGVSLKVKISDYIYQTKLSRWTVNPYGESRIENIILLSSKNAPKNIKTEMTMYNHEPEIGIVDKKGDKITTTFTNEDGFLELDVSGDPYYEITGILGYKRYVFNENYGGEISSDRRLFKEFAENMTGREIGRIYFTANNEKPFNPIIFNEETDSKYLRGYGKKLSFDYQGFRNLLGIYGKETQFAINERKKKQSEEENRRITEERRRENEIERERRRVEEENRRKAEAERKKAEEYSKLENIIESSIKSNLGSLSFSVLDYDNGLPIHNAEISITSDALGPWHILAQNGFLSEKLNWLNFSLPHQLIYPNSWDGEKWGNGSYCKTNYNHNCNFVVFKTAKHKISVKHPQYYEYIDEFTPNEDGLSQEIRMYELGTKIRINIFGGRGRRVRR